MVYALASDNTSIGNMLETFFVNQLVYHHQVEYASQGDFLINGKYTIEVRGEKKTDKQIKEVENTFVVADDIEYGIGNKIPL